ncbi:MAG: hypothetical protein KBD78_01315 [Oligoflexales bacterium]|nr:hypothetical protein [Oligoflexales bacterium]
MSDASDYSEILFNFFKGKSYPWLFFFVMTCTSNAFSQVQPTTKEPLPTAEISRNTSQETPLLFKDTYFAVTASKTMPLASGSSELSTSKSHWHLGYRYIFHPKWLLGVGGGFKLMKQKGIDRELPIFNLYQEINYMTRLFYPHFIYLGTKLLYLLPVQKAMIPMKKSLDYKQEVGVSIGLGYLYKLGENSFFDLRIDRWRGTATMKLHAAEVSLSYNVAI